jgi:SAM-dependent methyltransferase
MFAYASGVDASAWDAGARAWVERVEGAQWEMHDASIHDLLPPPSGLTLDVGCGEGRLTRELALLGYDVMGFDRSEALLRIARQADPGGRYEVAAIEALPVDDAAARLVLCVNLLPHVVDLQVAARELARVLAPGGFLVAGHRHPVAEAGTYDDETGDLRVRRYFQHEPHAVPLGDGHVFHQHRTIEDYVRALTGAGFVLDDLREVPEPGRSAPAHLDLRLIRLGAAD